MGFRARDIDAWSTASGETAIGGREGEREKEWKEKEWKEKEGEGAWMVRYQKGCRRERLGQRASRASIKSANGNK